MQGHGVKRQFVIYGEAQEIYHIYNCHISAHHLNHLSIFVTTYPTNYAVWVSETLKQRCSESPIDLRSMSVGENQKNVPIVYILLSTYSPNHRAAPLYFPLTHPPLKHLPRAGVLMSLQD